jgi:hypothetical protein
MGRGYTLGDVSELSSDALGGWQASGGVGLEIKEIVGGGVNFGVDMGLDSTKTPTSINFKGGISIGIGVSTGLTGTTGGGFATKAIPIIRFNRD